MRLVDYVSTVINQEKPLKFLLSKILMKLKISKFFLINRDDYHIRFYPSAYSLKLWLNNKIEIPTLRFIHDYLREGDCLIDVGANIGLVTIEASLIVGSKGKVFSIEPHPKTFNFLKNNIALNHLTNIEILNIALGEREGTILFSNIKSDDQNSIINQGIGVSVLIQRLENVVTIPRISLLKIDTEGYEKFVLLGATKLLENTECVYFEVSETGAKKYSYSIDEIYDILLDNNFHLFRIVNKREILPIEKTYKPKEISGEDLLAIRNTNDFVIRTGYRIRKMDAD